MRQEIQQLDNLILENASIQADENFVTCSNVQNRMPAGISTRFRQGLVWAWARVRAPKREGVTFRWYADGELFHTHRFAVEKSQGYRVYAARTYNFNNSTPNEVRLYNSQNHLIGRRVFYVGP